MSSVFGLTVDEALAQIMVAERIENEAERRAEIRKILTEVRSLGYHKGTEDARCDG
jgi:hypothetical protein